MGASIGISSVSQTGQSVTIGKVITPGANSNYTVTSSDMTILAANTSRSHAVLVNDSSDTIYLAFGNTAVINKGIRLNANGGAYEISLAQGNLTLLAIHAISSGTSSNITIQEDT